MKKPVLRKGTTIHVNAFTWFDRHNGNTYHNARVTIEHPHKDAEQFETGLTYGYGEQYLQTAFKQVWDKYQPCKAMREYLGDNLFKQRSFWSWQFKQWYRMEYSETEVSSERKLRNI
jgi:hypothetical protein